MKKLSKKAISELYGTEPGKEVLAFGRRMKIGLKKRPRRELTWEEVRYFKPSRPAVAPTVDTDAIEKI